MMGIGRGIRWWVTGVITVVLLGVVGCSGDEAAEKAEAAAKHAMGHWDEPVPIALAMNPAILKMLEEVERGCEVDEATDRAKACNNNQRRVFVTWVRKAQPKDIIQTLVNIGVAAERPKLRQIARGLLPVTFRLLRESKKKENANEQASKSFVWLLKKIQGPAAGRVAEVATHVATLAGTQDMIHEVLERHKSDEVRRAMYEAMMEYGRMDAFPTVREAANREDGKYIVEAMRSPYRMRRMTDEEAADICPWTYGFLKHSNLEVAASAARVLLRCGPGYHGKVVDEGKRRVKHGRFKPPFSDVFRDMCVPGGTTELPTKRQEKVCKRNYKFLESVARNDSVAPKVRGQALYAIYYQRRSKETMELMREFEDHRLKEVREHAQRAAKELRRGYQFR